MEVLKCPNCGSSILTNDKYCSFCGKEISAELDKHPIEKKTSQQLSRMIIDDITQSEYALMFGVLIGIAVPFILLISLVIKHGLFNKAIIPIIIAILFFAILLFILGKLGLFNNSKTNYVVKLARQKKFDEILKLENTELVIDYQILIAFYYKMDIDYAKHLLLKYRKTYIIDYIKFYCLNHTEELPSGKILHEVISYYEKNGSFNKIENEVNIKNKTDYICACCGAALPKNSSVCEYCGSVHYKQKQTELQKMYKRKQLPELSKEELIKIISKSTEVPSFGEFDAMTHVIYFIFKILAELFYVFMAVFGSYILKLNKSILIGWFLIIIGAICAIGSLVYIIRDIRKIAKENKFKHFVSKYKFDEALTYSGDKKELYGFKILLLFYYFYDLEHCLIILNKYDYGSRLSYSPAKQKQFKAIYDYFDIKKEKRK